MRSLSRFTQLAGGAALGQLIALAVMPWVTRTYPPSEYGDFSLFSTVVALLVPLCSLGLPQALPLPDDAARRVRIARASLIFAFVMIVCLSAVALMMEGAIGWVLLTACTVWITILAQVIYQMDLAARTFVAASRRLISQATVSALFKVSLGMIWPDGRSLAFSQMIGHLVFFRPSARLLTQFHRADPLFDVQLLRDLREFPLHQMPQQIMNLLSRLMPIGFLMWAVGAESAGQYALALLALGVVGQIVGRAYGDTLIRDFAERYNATQPLLPLLKTSTYRLILFGLVPYGLVVLIGPNLFTQIFGSAWREAGELAIWMAPWLWLASSNAPALGTIKVLKQQRSMTRLNAVTLPLRAVALLSGLFLLSDWQASVMLFALVGIIHNACVIGWGLHMARTHDASLPIGSI